ncbi:BON domain-containing protein [Lysobacter arvi]|uniref:BON domain-containing protein n=1 Tax=Lysobacter arvi TaxID=3038776 RepID=A0ABU1CA07_9GAMM|nr:BON domain-containing protein [Lysobacter arvi]MDR0181973.1 BON domain-containing protein [Lysobacter arvi]
MDDKQLRRHVLDELEFDPAVLAADIGVSAHDGVVTLTGCVPTYPQKLAAERAAWRVRGVKAVAQEIEVHYGIERPQDEQLAHRVLDSLAWNVDVPPGAVRVTVHKGWITLEGQVQWQHQRDSAEAPLRHLHGVTGITNNLVLGVRADADRVKERIEEALMRRTRDATQRIRVYVDGAAVVLDGEVDNWDERRAAEHAAWCVPNVRCVDDRLRIAELES